MQNVLKSLAVNTDFVKNMRAKFNLNPLNFITLASFSWKCAVILSKKELELLTDVNLILDYKNGPRGGITRAISHYDEGNNNTYMIMKKQNKLHIFHILILSINADRLCYNHFLMMDLIMLEIYQCLLIIF